MIKEYPEIERLLAQLALYPRRSIRYVMFRIKDTVGSVEDIGDVDRVLLKLISAIYPKQDGFDGWANFNVTWDIGVDDIPTMAVREDKWWLFGLPRTMAVKRGNRLDSKEDGITHFESLGLVEYVGDVGVKQPRLKFADIIKLMEPRRLNHIENITRRPK